MKKTTFSIFFFALLVASFVSSLAYLYWKKETIDIPLEGNYYNPFESFSFEDILQRIPGSIPILQYHIIMTPQNSVWLMPLIQKRPYIKRFILSSTEFRQQIETLYQHGFRPISLDEYLALGSGDPSSLKRLAPGTKPFVLTFDDATYGQLDFIDQDGDGKPEIDPNCAVGILLEFHKAYPDFALTAAFCIDFSNVPFLQPSYVKEKLNLLLDYGFEIVNHTKTHTSLPRLFTKSPQYLAKEIGGAMEKFESYLGYRAKSINKIAYPNGHVSLQIKQAVQKIHYKGKTYHFIAGLHAHGFQAPHPKEKRFDPYAIPRIEMSGKNFEKFVLFAPRLMTMPPLQEKYHRE